MGVGKDHSVRFRQIFQLIAAAGINLLRALAGLWSVLRDIFIKRGEWSANAVTHQQNGIDAGYAARILDGLSDCRCNGFVTDLWSSEAVIQQQFPVSASGELRS